MFQYLNIGSPQDSFRSGPLDVDLLSTARSARSVGGLGTGREENIFSVNFSDDEVLVCQPLSLSWFDSLGCFVSGSRAGLESMRPVFESGLGRHR